MTKRLSLILSETEQGELEPFVSPGTEQHRALARWADVHGAGSVNSAAAALRVLLRAGADSLRDDVLEVGYSELSVIYNAPDHAEERRAARERYIDRTDAAP